MLLQTGSRPVPNSPDYILIRKLGAGAFGEVWHAHGPGGLDVALKFIRLDAHVRTLELRSLEVMKSIRHPNLVSLFGAWHKDNWLILAMELCDRSLQDRLAEALDKKLPGMPLKELLSCMSDAANGLDALNAKQVQHRDVKPANLLLLDSGVKVADFGLAKALEQTVASNSGAGTLAYTAPECFKGQLTQQSDQYSLAVTYYHLRTGHLLFRGDQAQIMYAHLELEPDLSYLPAAEGVVLARALSKKPGKRWPSCKEFVNELIHAHQEMARQVEQRQRAEEERKREVERQRQEAERRRQEQERQKREAAERKRQEEEACKKAEKDAKQKDPFNPDRSRSPGETVTMKLSGNVLMTFAWCPPGCFVMGRNTKDDEGEEFVEGEYPEEQPAHRVKLTKGFYMGIHPVTQAEWKAVMGTDPSSFKGPNRPVENVSWDDCQEFCQRLTAHLVGKVTVRLPSEAEWEYACRAGTTTAFYFGDVINTDLANYDGNHSWNGAPKGNYREQTTDVGLFPPNAWGLFDMHGNVWEWCEDRFGYYDEDDQTNPVLLEGETVEEEEVQDWRVVRGGAWRFFPQYCRAACRDGHGQGDRNSDSGCRVCFHLKNSVVDEGLQTLLDEAKETGNLTFRQVSDYLSARVFRIEPDGPVKIVPDDAVNQENLRQLLLVLKEQDVELIDETEAIAFDPSGDEGL
jgi:formylglycine-generating enzyme required for sulfatase activity